MVWIVHFHDDFELDELPEEVHDELLGSIAGAGRVRSTPRAAARRYAQWLVLRELKELRFQKDGVWRFAFAFDPLQQEAIVLVGGDKEGESQSKF
jgi:hypothetical protein